MGGLENVVLNLAGGIDANKFSQEICVLSDELGLKLQFDKLNIPIYAFPKKRGVDWSLIFKLRKYFKESKADIIHTHNPTALLYGGTAAILARKKLVHTEHSNLLMHKKFLVFAESLLFRVVNHLICDTEEVKQSVHKNQGISLDKINVIFNGVDINKFLIDVAKEDAKKSLGLDSTSFIVGTVARLSPVKDQKSLIKSIHFLKEKGLNVHLVIVGDGELRNKLQEYSKECGIEDSVIFLGERTDAFTILKTFDAFVLCSLYEGMSVSLLEAMSSSLPCVVTDVGGNVELIKNGENGFVVPVQSPKAIGACLEKLIADSALCEQMGQKNRALVENKYSLEAMCTAYEKVYGDAVGSK